MPLGKCRLCGRSDVALQDSHLLPAGIYKLVRGADANPVLVTRRASVATSRQAHAHLLCSDCEHQFNVKGEDWVIRNCWRSPEDFPLQDGLFNAVPFDAGPGTRIYRAQDVPDLKIQSFVYFALSVFWRAAVRRWGKEAGDRITLGKYEEPLRKYLSQSAQFPDDIALAMMVNATKDPLTCQMMSLPWLAGRSPFHKFTFDIPGVSFWMFAGKHILPELKRTCAVRTGFVTICSEVERRRLTVASDMVRKTKTAGQLRRRTR